MQLALMLCINGVASSDVHVPRCMYGPVYFIYILMLIVGIHECMYAFYICMYVRIRVGPHNQEVNDVAIASDNTRFASAGGDRAAFLWDVAQGHVIRKFVGHDGEAS
jgi:WD40 repeat protein